MTPLAFETLHAAAFHHSRPWSRAEFANLLDNSGTFALGDARCAALVRITLDEAELLTLATHPDHRRQGLARVLMDLWHAKTRDRGATRAFLEVAADNTPAISLYESCGYAQCGLRRGYYVHPGAPAIDALVMEHAL
jgi:ribosomal-protein-alanine N-acetyltransferase